MTNEDNTQCYLPTAVVRVQDIAAVQLRDGYVSKHHNKMPIRLTINAAQCLPQRGTPVFPPLNYDDVADIATAITGLGESGYLTPERTSYMHNRFQTMLAEYEKQVKAIDEETKTVSQVITEALKDQPEPSDEN